MQRLSWQDQWSQDAGFIDPRVAQRCWLAIQRRFIQRLPKLGHLCLQIRTVDFRDGLSKLAQTLLRIQPQAAHDRIASDNAGIRIAPLI